MASLLKRIFLPKKKSRAYRLCVFKQEPDVGRDNMSADNNNNNPNESSSLELDFVLLLMCHNNRGGQLPNAAAVWLDPQWTGLWRECIVQKTKDFDNCGFRVQGTIRSMRPSWCCCVPETQRSLCNSIKIHFFQVRPAARKAGELSTDFLYGTALPLSEIMQEPTGGGNAWLLNRRDDGHRHRLYGVFNYNDSRGQSSTRISNIRVVIKNLRALAIPRDTQLLRLQGPGVEHHKRVVEVGDWLDIAFCEMWPEMTTSMSNTRTYFRDFCSTFFFVDICKLFDKQGRSNLPPWLACYALANALIVNNTSPYDFAGENYISSVTCSIPNPALVQDVMRVVKCVLTPWTMCVREGLYWDDMSLGKPVEDQPFPLSFVPTQRVFGKDDCEGRASQAQEMVELLVNIFLYVQSHGIDAAFAALQHAGTGKLRVSHTTLLALLQGCRKIGQLLYSKVLESQTVVGDANAMAISNPRSDKVQIIGHSFGIMLYDDGHVRDYMIVENTGWQRRRLPGDRPATAPELAFFKKWVGRMRKEPIRQHSKTVEIAGDVTKLDEGKIYQTLYMGHDRLFFVDSPKQGLKYGAALAAIDIAGVKKIRDTTKKAVRGRGRAVSMTMERVLQELSVEHQSSPPIWKARTGAAEMLAQYRRIQENLPNMRRALMTPQKTEGEFDALMRDWEPIVDADLPDASGPCKGLWCTVDKDVWQSTETWRMRNNGVLENNCRVKAHPFMHSMVVCVFSEA